MGIVGEGVGVVMKISQIHVGVGTQIGPLTVMPVWWAVDPAPGLVTGRQADVVVNECADGPEVAQLVVTNQGAAPALLLEGELLEGGYQDRALVSDLVLASGQTVTAPVVCVERGRWSGVDGHRRRMRRTSVGIRTALRDVHGGQRQSRVWSRVESYDRRFGASPTSALVDHLSGQGENTWAFDPESPFERAVDMLNGLQTLPGQQGVMVGVAGYPVLLEVFADPTGLTEHLRGALVGVLLDAAMLDIPWVATPGRRARRFAEQLSGVSLTADSDRLGAADSWVHQHRSLTATATVIAERAVHLTAVRTDHQLVQA